MPWLKDYLKWRPQPALPDPIRLQFPLDSNATHTQSTLFRGQIALELAVLQRFFFPRNPT
jgi:hypothetical protein